MVILRGNMEKRNSNDRASKQLNGLFGFFLLIVGFATVVAGILAGDGLLWMLPGLALSLVF